MSERRYCNESCFELLASRLRHLDDVQAAKRLVRITLFNYLNTLETPEEVLNFVYSLLLRKQGLAEIEDFEADLLESEWQVSQLAPSCTCKIS